MKICVKCGLSKENSLFYKAKNKSGLYSYCIECTKNRNADYYAENQESELARVKIYQKENEEILQSKRKAASASANEYQKQYKKNRRHVDPIFKLSCNIRRSVGQLFRGKKSKKTLELMGCSFQELKIHLEGLFQHGMSWDNYGKWHIDHKHPVSLAKSVDELEKLCHYTNLQPLWALDNLKKGNKLSPQRNLT